MLARAEPSPNHRDDPVLASKRQRGCLLGTNLRLRFILAEKSWKLLKEIRRGTPLP